MKKIATLILVFALIPMIGFTQVMDELNFISPFHDGVAAIKKDNKWAFINTNGDILVEYRDDLVITKNDQGNYPIFYDGRCLIETKTNGISYYGYIDLTGKTIIEPKFLNATNFRKGKAIALELIKENVSKNEALDKNIVYYKYFEVVINTSGEIEHYINPKGVNVVIDKDFLREPPSIMSVWISDQLIAIKDNKDTWSVIKLNTNE